MLQVKRHERDASAELLNDRGNHHRPHADRVERDHDEGKLKSQADTGEAVIKPRMGNGGRVLAADQIKDEIQGREYDHAPNGGYPENYFGKSHGSEGLLAADRQSINS